MFRKTRMIPVTVGAMMLSVASSEAAQRKVRYEPANLPAANFGKGEALQLGVGSLDVRYQPNDMPTLGAAQDGLVLKGWRGERVSNQLVLQPRVALTNVRLKSAGVVAGGKAIPLNLNFMRYTQADKKPMADIVDSALMIQSPANVNRPIWVSVDIPRDAAIGSYQGMVEVFSDQGMVKVPVKVVVESAPVLPAPKDWSFYLDLWQHPDAVARWHDVPMWSPEHFALMKPLMQRLANAGQKTITCTLIHEPWIHPSTRADGGQTYDLFESMVGWTKKKDGTFVYDYTIFDKWVTFMSKECGYEKAFIHCYTMLPWSMTFRYYDEAKSAYVSEHFPANSPGFANFWGPFLTDFVKHLKVKGWLARTRIGMDERADGELKSAVDVIKKYAPELTVASANDHPTGIAKEFEDLSPGFQTLGGLGTEWIKERAKEKKISTFYVCLNPTRPNTFTWSAPAEAEWLGIFASARNLNGMLRWAYNSWVENPLDSSDYTSWPSGDCFIVYPGNRSSLRFERLRDGIEDFEKIRILREYAAKSMNPRVKDALGKLDEELKEFNPEKGMNSTDHAAAVQRANVAIDALTKALAEK